MRMPKDFSGSVNLGIPGEFTMIGLVEKIKDVTGSQSEPVHKELPLVSGNSTPLYLLRI
jgi:hypothetical protein